MSGASRRSSPRSSACVRATSRPIGPFTHALDYTTLEPDALQVIRDLTPVERESRSRDGRTFMARLHPYRVAGGQAVSGVVVTFIDVTAMKRVEAALRESQGVLVRQAGELLEQHRAHEDFLAALATS